MTQAERARLRAQRSARFHPPQQRPGVCNRRQQFVAEIYENYLHETPTSAEVALTVLARESGS